MYKELVTFKNLPLSNGLLSTPNTKANGYDLKVGFDPKTCLVALYDNVSPEEMFNEDYVYDSSQSTTMIEHFKQAALSIQNKFECSRPLEIGSNSGIFIEHFSKDISLAVEPCDNFAKITADENIRTYNEYWGNEVTDKIIESYGKRDMIFSANTISHIQNLDECFSNVYKCLSDDGVFIIESPSFLELLKGNAFDQFYHEHQSYFGCLSLNNLLKKHNLSIFNIELYPVHGGTYRFFITKDNHYPMSQNVEGALKEEIKYGLNNYEILKIRMGTMLDNIKEINRTLVDLKQEGANIIGYGASAKFTQVTNMSEVDNNIIDFVMDTTPDKQNKYLPKSNIKILPYSKELLRNVDYCFLGAWNYKKEIMDKEIEFLEAGGKFITHIPTIQIYDISNR